MPGTGIASGAGFAVALAFVFVSADGLISVGTCADVAPVEKPAQIKGVRKVATHFERQLHWSARKFHCHAIAR